MAKRKTHDEYLEDILTYISSKKYTIETVETKFNRRPITKWVMSKNGNVVFAFSVQNKFTISHENHKVASNYSFSDSIEIPVFMRQDIKLKCENPFDQYKGYKNNFKKFDELTFPGKCSSWAKSISCGKVITNAAYDKMICLIDFITENINLDYNLEQIKPAMPIINAMVTCSFGSIFEKSLHLFKDTKNTINLNFNSGDSIFRTVDKISLTSNQGYMINILPVCTFNPITDELKVDHFNVILTRSVRSADDADLHTTYNYNAESIIKKVYNYCEKTPHISSTIISNTLKIIAPMSEQTIFSFGSSLLTKRSKCGVTGNWSNATGVHSEIVSFKVDTKDIRDVKYNDFEDKYLIVNDLIRSIVEIMETSRYDGELK